ncbi:MAG: GNVR domain-containing protein, partial [Hyphomicrobiaceae bacterium]
QSRMVDLRKQVETAENAVETFRTKAGLLGSPNLLLTEQQLQQTNDKLILARSQTAVAKARFDQVKDLSARGGSALLAAQSDALKSAVIANLRAALSRVERREAIVQQTLRPGHPEYGGVQVEKRAVMTQIEEELNRIKANARGEFELAQSNEKSLTNELKSLETQTATGNQSQVRLRELQREAQAAKAIFEQFLNRAKETSEQESLGRENSRIISEATVPPYPTFPPTFLVLCGALLAGLMAGAGTAWLAHMFSTTPDSGANMARIAPVVSGPAPPDLTKTHPPASHPSTMAQASVRPRLRKMLAPMARPAKPATKGADLASTLATVATQPRVVGGTAGLETLARLPALASFHTGAPADPGNTDGATGAPSFSDHIAAVDDASATAYPGYREAIDQILAGLQPSAAKSKTIVALLVGTEAAADSSSTALALAYRAAVTGRRTLLIDVAAADPRLSQVFAANLRQRRACVLDSEAHLAEITLHDARTGLSILPMALADLARLDPDQQRRLVKGLRQLGRRFDLVIMDAGIAADNQGMGFLTTMVDKVLIVTAKSSTGTGLNLVRAMETAQRFPTRSSPPAIIETSAA